MLSQVQAQSIHSHFQFQGIQNKEMESLSPMSIYDGIKSYLRRRRYRRLHGGTTVVRRKMAIIRLRGPRRNWRVRAIPRLRWVMRSPLKMLTKLKNAYMNFMLRLSRNVGAINSDNIFEVKRIPKARQVSKGYSSDEFEARLIFEISKTLVASYELHPM